MNRCKVYGLFAGCFLWAAALLPAQSEYLDKDQKGVGATIFLDRDEQGRSRIGGSASYSVNGFVDLGAAVTLSMVSLTDIVPAEFSFAFIWNFTLLKQDRTLPFSVSFPGYIRKMLSVDDNLTSQGLIRNGTGYSLGIDLFRYFPVAYRRYARIGIVGRFDSGLYLTELESGVSNALYPLAESYSTFAYGIMMGLSMRPSKANRGVAVSLDAMALFDTNMRLRLSFQVNLTMVENKIERMNE